MANNSSASIVVLGDCAVGKSTLVSTLLECCDGSRGPYNPTVGVKSSSETGELVAALRSSKEGYARCRLWEVSGSDAFDALRLSYFKRSQGAIFIFNAKSSVSLESTLRLVVDLKKTLPIEVVARFPILLIGNRPDEEVDAERGLDPTRRDVPVAACKQGKKQQQGHPQPCSETEIAERASRLKIAFTGVISVTNFSDVLRLYGKFREEVIKNTISADLIGGDNKPQQLGLFSLLSGCIADSCLADTSSGGGNGNEIDSLIIVPGAGAAYEGYCYSEDEKWAMEKESNNLDLTSSLLSAASQESSFSNATTSSSHSYKRL